MSVSSSGDILGSILGERKHLFLLISPLGIVECGNRLDTDKHVLVRGEAYGLRKDTWPPDFRFDSSVEYEDFDRRSMQPQVLDSRCRAGDKSSACVLHGVIPGERTEITLGPDPLIYLEPTILTHPSSLPGSWDCSWSSSHTFKHTGSLSSVFMS
ncbi:hypothetical protein BO86DRAFT_381392 [Aspergillus japonicus CBS 114.51]|uniref:Uncharacterized protein n=2 Tax=Aspergillus TaxID=5052 RepID=A0A2V5GY55_ASPV1|nr:hypothetical protein BO86DRAFT_381392 [Aspergillus japonicus CBS 114.51]PYI14262.1 hypothetical protein BO99DRAFT_416953 [Aspergillus violaceofuscus CBS 115571]RAH79282.1 hypothetical protein BO86DRAFT_381392 [Aspergillus japonicus CBS 114.51]